MPINLIGATTAAAIVMCAAQGPPPVPRMPRPGATATSSATQVVSPAALMTWMTRYGHDGVHSLDLIVLWRGQPGWFMRGTSRSASSGGSAGSFHSTIRYGGLEVQLTLESAARVAEIQEKGIELGDANVILVDDVDTAAGPRVVGTLRIDPTVPSGDHPGRMGEILRKSSEVVSFLRCDAAMPDGKGQAMVDRICAQVLGRGVQ